MPIGTVVVALASLAFVAFVYATKPRRDAIAREQAARDRAAQAKDECSALQDLLAVKRVQGADLNELSALEAQVANCVRRTGADSPWAASVRILTDKRRQVEQEWSNYRSTGTEDAIKRNNTRGTILRLADDYATDARRALALVSDAEGGRALVSELTAWVEAADSRARCFVVGSGECSRYGLNEPHSNDRAMDEIVRGVLPHVGSRGVVDRFGAFIWERFTGSAGDEAVARISGVDVGLLDRARAFLAPAPSQALGPSVARGRVAPGTTTLPAGVKRQLSIR